MTPVLAHGMEGSLVAPDWPALTIAELRPLLAAYPDAGEPDAITFASPRPFSAAAVVRCTHGSVFVKRHARSIRDCEGLGEEHRFLAYLHEHGAPVPRVLANADGETAVEAGPWTYEVQECAAGMDLYRDAFSWTPFNSADHAHAAGAALARLHLAAAGFAAPPRKPRPLVASCSIFAGGDPAAGLEAYLDARPLLAHHAGVRRCAAEALKLLEPFYAELQPLLPHLTPLWTHNDLHASNLFWSGAGAQAHPVTIIDFGLADQTYAVHGLAHAIERNIVEWLSLPREPAVHFDHLQALLSGYASVRPLTRAERAALAPMMALCHVEVALSEADYFLRLPGESRARLAYEGWLLGHARWFAGAAGGRLCDYLRSH
ncbi:MAG: aminoglycoside phosphotransferase family protein [Acidobacteria bacterium]|nr:MAG: aminoglycoside phosphotransferase family protein [Acidobacteriota bacterium]